MWNYPYDNGYDIYNNCGYNFIGTQPNQNSLYYVNHGSDTNADHSLSQQPIIHFVHETPVNFVDDILSGDKSNKTIYNDFNGYPSKQDYYDSSTETSTKENSYCDPETYGNSNLTDKTSKFEDNSELSHNYETTLFEDLPGNNLDPEEKELVSKRDNDQQFDKLDSNLTGLTNDISQGNNLHNDVANNTYDYTAYSSLSYYPWNISNLDNTDVNQMNATYLWDPNLMNNVYYNGYNAVNQSHYDDMGYNFNNNSSLDSYNMTQDPYTMNFMKTAPNTIDISNSFNIPYGNIFSPNEAFVTPSIKYPNRGHNNFVPLEHNNFFMNQNLDSQYNYFNKPKQFKQNYNKSSLNDTRGGNNMGRQMELISNVENETPCNLKSIDEDTLESFIYSGNIKKIDMASIDFINMSDRIWQALRGAGLFKLGNKGRAILKSKISKHLKMYPELKMRTACISGVRRATTRQLFQLAQVCQITSHLR